MCFSKKILNKALIFLFVIILVSGCFSMLTYNAYAVTFSDEYDDFLYRMGNRESHNNYSLVASDKYYGRWQTTVGPIINCGLMNSDGSFTSFAARFGVYSMSDYLNSSDAQYYNVYTYHRAVWQSLCKLGAEQYLGTYIRGCYVNIAGIVGLSHEYGYGNAIQFLRESGDGWNKALTVFDLYNDFDISATITGPAIDFTAQLKRPTISSIDFTDISAQGFTAVIKASDDVGISSVRMSAWCSDGNGSDKKWYTASKDGEDYVVTVYTKDHIRKAYNYTVNAEVKNIYGNMTELSMDITLPDFYCETCLDATVENNERVKNDFLVAGWCFCKRYPETAFYLTVDGKTTVLPKVIRDDVKNVYSLSFNDVGFSTYINTENLNAGKHTYKIFTENEFGIPFVITERNFILLRTDKQFTVSDKYYDYGFYKSNLNFDETVEFCNKNGLCLAEITDDNISFIADKCDGNYYCSNGVINKDGFTNSDNTAGFIVSSRNSYLEILKTEIDLNLGESEYITYSIYPEENPVFSDFDTNICSVAEDGKVTALSHGKTTVKVTAYGITKTVEVICTNPTPEVLPSQAGDVNGDNITDSKDLVRLKKYLAGQNSVIYTGADVNGDGKVDSKDLVRLKKKLAGNTLF